jgi:hypothetical protein
MTGAWRRTFEGHVATVMCARGLPRLEAERVAFEIVLVEHLNATHPDTDPSRCAHTAARLRRRPTPCCRSAPAGAMRGSMTIATKNGERSAEPRRSWS